MSSENKTSIKVIVELHAKPGRRAELKNLLASVVAKYGSVQPGFLGSHNRDHDEIKDQPKQAMNAGAYAPLEDLLAAPFRATVIRQLL